MEIGLFIGLIMWIFLGTVTCLAWSSIEDTDGWALCNPYWVYKKYHQGVNWFGAIVLSLLYTALCPIGAVCYWFYKLCTVGRR